MVKHGGKQSIAILLYHSISSYARPGFTCISTEVFSQHLWYLDQNHYVPVTVTQFARAMSQGGDGLPPRSVVLTFDDGYADFYTNALPVLQRHSFLATLYIPTEFVGATSRWMQYKGEGMHPILTWTQLAEIAVGGIECGAHSHTHRPLDMLPPSIARDEIIRSKELLEDNLGQQISSFAYPYGHYSPIVQKLVQKAGYTSACSVKNAMSTLHDNPYSLMRLAITPRTDVRSLDLALTTGRGSLIAPPLMRVRTEGRQILRTVYATIRSGAKAG